MKPLLSSLFVTVCLLCGNALGQTSNQTVSKKRERGTSRNGTLKICQGLPIPAGYTIVGYMSSSACPHGAYVLKKQESPSPFSESQVSDAKAGGTRRSSSPPTAVSRPRRVSTAQRDPVVPDSQAAEDPSNAGPPTLVGMPVRKPSDPGPPTLSNATGNTATARQPLVLGSTADAPDKNVQAIGDEEVSDGDVVRIETNLVTVPVSVLDRHGRFVPNLRREDFRVFENGNERQIAYFEPTEKPFTVALVLDMSASTQFHLWEIKAAAIAFARQLRPLDRVLVVTFNDQVLLLTEATNDLEVVSAVIEQNATTGQSTRLYDAVNLVINERLNKIKGRKAIVLFTDGVDTSSYMATYESTLREAEELDALVYPIQYDTTDYRRAMQGGGSVTVVTTTTNNWPFPSGSSSRTVYNAPLRNIPLPGTTEADYERADQYLHQLADKTGARLYQANDPQQLAQAFSRIAEELRRQYSLGYYPPSGGQSGERRLIRVRVNKPDLAVRARDSYVQRVAPATTQ